MEIIGLPNSHDAIRRLLRGLPPSNILDIPCGTGVITKYLHDLGWKVHSADIDRGNLEYVDATFSAVDLNQELPFDDASFDNICCINGLHRLYNISGAVSEFSRILKPGGRLLININNYASIKSRIRFLLFGSLDAALNSGDTRQTIEDPSANFRQALMLPQIANELDRSGFEIVSTHAAAKKLVHHLLWPIALVIKAASYLVPKARRKRQYLEITASNAMNPGGDYLLIEAIKIRS